MLYTEYGGRRFSAEDEAHSGTSTVTVLQSVAELSPQK
jgi:hypothetical protein